MHARTQQRLFCTTQQLSILTERTDVRRHLSGEQFWRDRHTERTGREEPSSPWKGVDRDKLVDGLTRDGDLERLAVVCAAGLGKSTNLRWLAAKLAAEGSQQVPFFFELDDADLPDNQRDFWNLTLPRQIRLAGDNSGLTDEKILPVLLGLRSLGRITLLLDSIDQASKAGLSLVRDLLGSRDWNGCPIVLSARPHAIFDRWEELIGPDEARWRFVRVEPLAVGDRKLLLSRDGIDRYKRLPPGGQELMANPRNIKYVLKCDAPETTRTGREPDAIHEFTLHDLRTASHVFAGAADHMIRSGMASPEARKLWCDKSRPPPREASQRQIEFALDLLGALAYTMFCSPSPDQQDGGVSRPNVSHVPVKAMPQFTRQVHRRLRDAEVCDPDYRIEDLEGDLLALAQLNAEIKFDLLDSHRHDAFRWYDRSLQEFFAAWWLSRYARSADHERLRRWRYGSLDDTARTLYQPLWGFLSEMPWAVWEDRIPVWVQAIAVLYEADGPRCSAMIFRSWPGLEKTPTGQKVIGDWQTEYPNMCLAPGPVGNTARSIRDGFRPCPKDPDDAGKPFLMGSPLDEQDRKDDEAQHPVTLSPFRMHQHAVTNAQYELFGPDHRNHRWKEGAPNHPAGNESADHPVVNVTWFDAWSFARWT
jgi:hypothetical protein